MKFWKSFDIEVIKFKEGKHEIVFEIGDSFFQNFEDNEIVDLRQDVLAFGVDLVF